MVRAQMLSELEEIILYKQYADQPERQQTMRRTWMKRYVGREIIDFRIFIHTSSDYRDVSRTLKCGNAFYKYGLWCSILMTTRLSGSNSQIYAASPTAWCSRTKQLTLCSRQKGYVHGPAEQ